MNLIQNLSSITPEFVQSYLSRSGWIEEKYNLNENFKYKFQNTDLIVFVPKNTYSKDYQQSLFNVINTLSQLEERDMNSIIKNITSPSVDTLKFRFIGAGTAAGSLPLEYTLIAIENIRDILVYSACAEISAKPMFNRALKDAKRIIEKSRFGQTEIGSFVISVDMPLDLQPIHIFHHQLSIKQETENVDPIQRRVITRIIKSAQKARSIAINGDSIDLDNEFKTSLNANLADALANFKKDGINLSVEISAIWDQSLPSKNLPNTSVIIEERTFDTLRSIGNVLRGSISSRKVFIIGNICCLSRDNIADETDEEIENTVIIKTNEDDLPKKIAVALNKADYIKACNWHRDKKQVKINGTLEKSGRTWLLTGYSDFVQI